MPQTSMAPSRPISAGRKGAAGGAPSAVLGGTGSGTVGKTGFVTESGVEGEGTGFEVVVAVGAAVAVAASDALRAAPKGVPAVASVARVVGLAVLPSTA